MTGILTTIFGDPGRVVVADPNKPETPETAVERADQGHNVIRVKNALIDESAHEVFLPPGTRAAEQKEESSMTAAQLEPVSKEAAILSHGVTMKALVYHGPGKRAWEDKPHPSIQDSGDAIVRIITSTICGTDLHILKGDLPAVTDGRILGHEGIGVIEQVGAGVSEFHVGDKVIISCVTACLKCDFCKRGMYSHCRHGGWILGYTIDGTQAE